MSKKKKMLLTILIVLLAVVLFAWYFLNTPIFGKLPSGKRLERIEQSPNYKNGSFQNLSPTPQMAEGHSMWKVMYNFLFNKPHNVNPKAPIPTVKTDLYALSKDIDQLVWLGHSSYYFTLNGRSYLVDPVFSSNASPIPGSNKAFNYTYNYTAKDIPQVDYLLITHDHFDHLDYETIVALQSRIHKVVCGLGVGEHFEYWGYAAEQIHELDWYDVVNFEQSINIAATPARHFSGRTLMRNTSLFCSFVLYSGDKRIFIGGDSGYDTHFRKIGEEYGPFDLAILENGQYNEAWRNIHTLPSELPLVMHDINAKTVLPVHSAKFALAMHDWKEPLVEAMKNASSVQRVITPMIGQVVDLDDTIQTFEPWWTNIK